MKPGNKLSEFFFMSDPMHNTDLENNKSLVRKYKNLLEALDLIADGYTVTWACAEACIPLSSFRHLIKRTEALAARYEEARQRGADALADALLNPVEHPVYGTPDPRTQKVISDNIKWLLARRHAAHYGDKVAIDVNLSADQAVINALSAARERVGRIIDNPN